MKLFSLRRGFITLLLTGAVVLPQLVLAQDLADAKKMCADMTAQNRTMAKAAGYDIDKLCRSLSMQGAGGDASAVDPIIDMSPRQTVSTPSAVAIQGPATDEPKKVRPYGYDIFAGSPNSFQPNINIPVPPDYLMGPGDTLEILLFGKTNDSFSLEVSRDGTIDFPELGPLVVAGMTFAEVKDMLQTRIASQIIGVQASISMGRLRSLQVFVLGEAYKPGAYTLSSLATITHALVSSGGVSGIASLRNIQLKRAGKIVATLDLYDLLMRGDASSDLRLQNSDVIFIPTRGPRVTVEGEILRPAIYELKDETSVEQVVSLAGGLTAKAHMQLARLERIQSDGFMTVLDLNLRERADRATSVQAGDTLTIGSGVDLKKNIISLAGHIYHAGDLAWFNGIRVSDVVYDADQFPPDLDLDFAILSREVDAVGSVELTALKASDLLDKTKPSSSMFLLPKDKIIFFSVSAGRQDILDPLISKLRSQERTGAEAPVVGIAGKVKFPGEYPLTEGMTLSTLIAAAGGFLPGASLEEIEIVRQDLSQQRSASKSAIPVSLSGAADGATFGLQAGDRVAIRTIPDYAEKTQIELAGEVRFPGVYIFERGETLSDVIDRAGGLTDLAFPEGAFLSRRALIEAEDKELKRLSEKVESELAAAKLQGGEDALEGKDAIAALKALKATGRLVIDLKGVLAGVNADIALEDGDSLRIPAFNGSVSIIGEVQRNVNYTYDSAKSLSDYIEMAGGYKDTADEKRVYVVKASGEIINPNKRSFFRFNQSASLSPGDTIVVPIDTSERKKGLEVLADVSQIIYQLSLGAAAFNSFGI
uniref:SLBB domain-containing protein n=1 Tax=Algoriphagus sp. TaxID=1872435 RepID=UPI004048240D